MTKVIAGNWKMHHGPSAAVEFFSRFRPAVREGSVRIALFTPALSLASARRAAAAAIEIGAQHIHWERSGAFTGELSAEMASEVDATLALIGHSERRHLFGETDAEVARKVRAAIRAELTPVVCVGELLEERTAGRLDEVLARQVGAVAEALATARDFMVAYEPVWAIGTGETATPEDATAAHRLVRSALGELGGAPVLYGGSVNPANAAALLSAPDVDGVLVGGASLDPIGFGRIVEAGVGGCQGPLSGAPSGPHRGC
ncbi:MAG: triose-phosphate isomerase [Gemmatimonadetes bacterium]|nr:triose-phosphate isomerase [Gemmatimonadota bacterium]